MTSHEPSGTHVQTLKAHGREPYRLTQAGPPGPTRQPYRNAPAWSTSRRGSEGARGIPRGGRVEAGDWPPVGAASTRQARGCAPAGTHCRTPLATAACARVHVRFSRPRCDTRQRRVGAGRRTACPRATAWERTAQLDQVAAREWCAAGRLVGSTGFERFSLFPSGFLPSRPVQLWFGGLESSSSPVFCSTASSHPEHGLVLLGSG
jgi:hypothetical protein